VVSKVIANPSNQNDVSNKTRAKKALALLPLDWWEFQTTFPAARAQRAGNLS
jgi:hypothetical protein